MPSTPIRLKGAPGPAPPMPAALPQAPAEPHRLSASHDNETDADAAADAPSPGAKREKARASRKNDLFAELRKKAGMQTSLPTLPRMTADEWMAFMEAKKAAAASAGGGCSGSQGAAGAGAAGSGGKKAPCGGCGMGVKEGILAAPGSDSAGTGTGTTAAAPAGTTGATPTLRQTQEQAFQNQKEREEKRQIQLVAAQEVLDPGGDDESESVIRVGLEGDVGTRLELEQALAGGGQQLQRIKISKPRTTANPLVLEAEAAEQEKAHVEALKRSAKNNSNPQSPRLPPMPDVEKKAKATEALSEVVGLLQQISAMKRVIGEEESADRQGRWLTDCSAVLNADRLASAVASASAEDGGREAEEGGRSASIGEVVKDPLADVLLAARRKVEAERAEDERKKRLKEQGKVEREKKEDFTEALKEFGDLQGGKKAHGMDWVSTLNAASWGGCAEAPKPKPKPKGGDGDGGCCDEEGNCGKCG